MKPRRVAGRHRAIMRAMSNALTTLPAAPMRTRERLETGQRVVHERQTTAAACRRDQ
jgi:hypothetical protein